VGRGDRGSRGIDAIARDFASGAISRRTALRRFAGVGLGALLPGALFADEAFARCPKDRRCNGRCCPKHGHCARGKCKCDRGYTKCGSKCRNLKTDPQNCGACGHACDAGETCVGGACVSALCGNAQIDPGEQCDGANLDGKICQSLGFYSGVLACAPDCTFDTSGCNCEPWSSKCDGACTSPDDVNNCGGCGNVCDGHGRSTNTQCYQGQCYYTCPDGYQSCDSTGARLNGCECEGTACCSGACQTKHSNGTGGQWFDCQPLHTYDANQALAACMSHTGSFAQCGSPSVCTGGSMICSADLYCWGYGGGGSGHVSSGTGLCPTSSDPAWT
jgi:hypothetical protein